jgi:hypothetical protein
MAIKTINLPVQKTFKFKRGTTPEQIDAAVNQWLREIVLKGQVPFKIESYTGFFGTTYMTYLITIPTQVEVADAPSASVDPDEEALKEHIKSHTPEPNEANTNLTIDKND